MLPLVAILAAGGATRFGGGKLDADCGGKPVGAWVIEAAAQAGLPTGAIVVGPQSPQFAVDSDWSLLVNENADKGLGTSLALAASHALAAQRDLLVLLADMPLADPEHLRALVRINGAAASIYRDGRLGVPAVFPLAQLAHLANIAGDGGAGPLLNASGDVAGLEPPEDMLLDVDTREDLARVEQLLLKRG